MKYARSSASQIQAAPAPTAQPLRLLAIVLTTAIGLFAAGSPAQAKDLTNRLGVGYKNQFSNDLPSIAFQYYPGRELGLSAEIGVDTAKDTNKFGAMAKIHRIIFEEQNMNFYMGAGLGLISQETAGKNDSGFQLMGFAGAEFFLSGLENLGFSFEVGAGVTSISSQVRFQTIGDSPLRAGMTFYF